MKDANSKETFEKLKKQTGLMCGGMSLLFVLLAILPLIIVLPLEYIVASFSSISYQ